LAIATVDQHEREHTNSDIDNGDDTEINEIEELKSHWWSSTDGKAPTCEANTRLSM